MHKLIPQTSISFLIRFRYLPSILLDGNLYKLVVFSFFNAYVYFRLVCSIRRLFRCALFYPPPTTCLELARMVVKMSTRISFTYNYGNIPQSSVYVLSFGLTLYRYLCSVSTFMPSVRTFILSVWVSFPLPGFWLLSVDKRFDVFCWHFFSVKKLDQREFVGIKSC